MVLKIDDICKWVRNQIDEIQQEGDDLLTSFEKEDRNIDKVIEDHVCESVDFVNLIAPRGLFVIEEDVAIEKTEKDFNIVCLDNEDIDKVYEITLSLSNGDYFNRFLSFVANDSSIALSNAHVEDSVVARMQLNKYIRGRKDSPVLIEVLSNESTYKARYYTTKLNKKDFKFKFYYVPRCSIKDKSVKISSELKEAILYHITHLVMVSYSNTQLSEVFYNKVKESLMKETR